METMYVDTNICVSLSVSLCPKDVNSDPSTFHTSVQLEGMCTRLRLPLAAKAFAKVVVRV